MAVRIAEQMRHSSGRRASDSEMRSWERSLPILAQDLVGAGLGRVEMIVEHALPLSSKRIDVVLAGQHPSKRTPSYLVVELKQWSAARRWEDEPGLVTVDAYGHRPVLHPLAQVKGYCEYLVNFTRVLHDMPECVAGAAYLHNALDEGAVEQLRDFPQERYSACSRALTGRHGCSTSQTCSIRRFRALRTRTCCCTLP